MLFPRLRNLFPEDFPGGPVVETLHYHSMGYGFDPGSRN